MVNVIGEGMVDLTLSEINKAIRPERDELRKFRKLMFESISRNQSRPSGSPLCKRSTESRSGTSVSRLQNRSRAVSEAERKHYENVKNTLLGMSPKTVLEIIRENPKRDCDRMPSQEEREIVKEEIVNNRRIITVRRGHFPAGCHAATTNMMINEAIKKFY